MLMITVESSLGGPRTSLWPVLIIVHMIICGSVSSLKPNNFKYWPKNPKVSSHTSDGFIYEGKETDVLSLLEHRL